MRKRSFWHGFSFVLVGLYVLGTQFPSGPAPVRVGWEWQIPVSIGLMGFGLFLFWYGEWFFNLRNLVVEYYEAIVWAVGIALVIRTFLVEPFRIPSGSMIPTLLVGDYLFVNKYAFGFRVPFTEYRLWMGEGPRRGDVAVFKYPLDPSKDYIKRVVGLPGDVIRYQDKQLSINGVVANYRLEGAYAYVNEHGLSVAASRYAETLDGVAHDLLVSAASYPATTALEVKVPDHHYFVLGDNRDNSNDSRYWGFVPGYWLVGRAVALFWSWDRSAPNEEWYAPWRQVRWSRLGEAIR